MNETNLETVAPLMNETNLEDVELLIPDEILAPPLVYNPPLPPINDISSSCSAS